MRTSARLPPARPVLNLGVQQIIQVDHDFGKRLTQARLARGVTVEEAAHATRMRPGMIRALEDGNLSQFPNAAYAKSFLLLYAKYLGTDIKDVARGIDTSTQMRVEDFQYLTSRASEEKRLQKDATDTRYEFVVPQKTGGSWMPLIIIAVLGVISAVGFMVWNNLKRLDTAVSDSAPAKTSSNAGVEPVGVAPEKNLETPVAPEPIAGTPPPEVTPGTESPRSIPPFRATVPAGTDAPATVGATPAAPGRPEPPVLEITPARAGDEETTRPVLDPGTIVLDPHRKSWVTIRNGPGGQLLYEDFLYPTAKPMHLPPGRYFIELKDAAAVEISKDGKMIAYTAPGILLE
jgi:cytoskeletal protein RodZ